MSSTVYESDLEKAAEERPEAKQTDSPRPGEPFQNPLPVPKRHARRNMGFSVEPSLEQLCYDILPPEDDDFDL